MSMVLVQIPSIHILEAVAYNVLLGYVPMRCPKLLLPARMSSTFPHRNFTTKFVANFYRIYESSLCGIS
jgi:hypothetical protein